MLLCNRIHTSVTPRVACRTDAPANPNPYALTRSPIFEAPQPLAGFISPPSRRLMPIGEVTITLHQSPITREEVMRLLQERHRNKTNAGTHRPNPPQVHWLHDKLIPPVDQCKKERDMS